MIFLLVGNVVEQIVENFVNVKPVAAHLHNQILSKPVQWMSCVSSARQHLRITIGKKKIPKLHLLRSLTCSLVGQVHFRYFFMKCETVKQTRLSTQHITFPITFCTDLEFTKVNACLNLKMVSSLHYVKQSFHAFIRKVLCRQKRTYASELNCHQVSLIPRCIILKRFFQSLA